MSGDQNELNQTLNAALRVVRRLQNENARLRDALNAVLDSSGYFIHEVAPRVHRQAKEALVIRYGDDDPDPDRFDDSWDRGEEEEED